MRMRTPGELVLLLLTAVTAEAASLTTSTGYHSYEEMTESLNETAAMNEPLARLYDIGSSVEGRKLWVMELSDADPSQIVPNVKLIGNIHGNEPVGKEILLELIEYLIDQYRKGDSYVVWLLKNTRIHVLPCLNPDGYERAVLGICRSGPGRNNANRYDLDRNYPWIFEDRQDVEQPETEAVRRWMRDTAFVLSASLHAGTLAAVYPFDAQHPDASAESETADSDIFQHLAGVYASANPTMSRSSCDSRFQLRDGITNGAAWHPFSGGMQDYNYVFHGCMEITLEVACCHYPFPQELTTIWKQNEKALIGFLGEAQRGVKGVVRDRLTGAPVPGAAVAVASRNINFTTTQDGYYWKLLMPDSYYLTVDAEGYKRKYAKVVIPPQKGRTPPVRMDIELDRLRPPTVRTTTTTTTTTTARTTTSTGTSRGTTGGGWRYAEDEPGVRGTQEWPLSAPVISWASRTTPLLLAPVILLLLLLLIHL